MSALLELQAKFTELLPRLLDYARLLEVGTDIRHVVAELYRPPETAALYATQGRGSKNSLHCDKLAVDLLVFRAGVYCGDADPFYAQLGAYWQSLDHRCRWGGLFQGKTKGDFGHFSLTDGARA